METVSRLIPECYGSFFLFGARGTGKSTWLKRKYADAIYLDLLSPENLRIYSAKPERLRELVEGNPDKKTIVIDEIQKVPELLNVVHQLIETDKRLNFIMTGSSSRKLKRTGIDLLSGRALLRTCHPFLASEIGKMFDIGKAMEIGMLPIVNASDSPIEVIKSYASLYLKEEVQAEGLVRNLGAFSRFLEIISFSHSSVLNAAEISRECSVDRKTVESYIGILEDLLLSFRLNVFTKRAKRILISHQKFYYFDVGVYRSLRPCGPLDSPEEIGGSSLEGLVAQHLVAWNAYSGGENNICFWRTKSGNEVDFIVYGKNEFTAIEVKNTGKTNTKEFRGLLAFKEDYPEARLIFLYRGKERLKINGISCIPCDEFLRNVIPGKKLPFSD